MITKEEINELKDEFNKRISELENKLEPKQGLKRWKPDGDEVYNYVSDDVKVRYATWDDDNFDNFRYSQGNCFKTVEEAEDYFENLKTKAELRALAEELNGDEVIDWEDDYQRKFFIFRNTEINPLLLRQDWRYTSQSQGTIYCLDYEFLTKAIDRIGEDRLIKLIKGGV